MNKKICTLFSELHKTYEITNHLLTWWLDIYWRRSVAGEACKSGAKRYLDVCCGTGEMASNLKRGAENDALIVALDFNFQMLQTAASKEQSNKISFIRADAALLPFRDASFDTITISFATRNLNTDAGNLNKCLIDFRRVLKPDGKFINLETTQPRSAFIRYFFHLYVKIFIKPVGTLISGSKAGYVYLSRTIPRFYSAEELVKILRDSGFSSVKSKRFFPGIVAMHESIK